jgi:lipopolysaccharide export system protein LptA
MRHMPAPLPFRPVILALLVAALPVAAAGPVHAADPPVSSLRDHDTSSPIDVDAERIEVRDADAQALFSGNVKVRQGKMALDADRIRVFYRRAGNDDLTILRLDADGGVKLASPSEQASARSGVYDVEERQLTMVGDVVLNRGGSVLRGQRLTIDLDTGRSTLDGGSAGGASTTPGSSGGGRVSGRFVVPERQDPAR